MAKKRTQKYSTKQKRDNPDSPIYQNRANYSSYRQNKIFQQNMLALQRHYPEIVKMLEETPPGNNYEVIETSTRFPTLRAKSENIYYYDPVDPIKDVENQISALDLKNNRLAVFLGFGLGYEVYYYLEKIAPIQKTAYVLIIEKDPLIFLTALKTFDLVPIITNSRVKLMVGIEESSLFCLFTDYFTEQHKFLYARAMKPVYHLSALKLAKDYYLNALKTLRESATQRVLYVGNCPEDSLIGIENMLENLDEIVLNPGINLLFDKFKGKPGIVVSSGPSLNKNKHLLKGLEEKAVIVCADSTLRILIGMGVKPHLVASLERIPPTVKVMEGFKPEEVEDVYYAACPVVPRGAYDVYPGPRIIVYRLFDHFKWLGIEKGMLHIKQSAGNMAFKLAAALGCDPIILIGQDLAFSRDGDTHAKGSDMGEKQAVYYQRNKIEVMGNDGEPIFTEEGWYPCIKGYEMDVAEYGGTVINSTEGGAYIQGTVVMPFKESINKHINKNIYPLQEIKKYLSPFSPRNWREDALDVLKTINTTINDMQEIIENCKQGITLHEKYREGLEQFLKKPDELSEAKDRLSEIHDEMMSLKINCTKSYETWNLFFTHVVQSYTLKFEMEMLEIPEKHDDQDMAMVEVLLRHAEWYAVIGDLAGVCLNSLFKAKQTLQRKLDGAKNELAE